MAETAATVSMEEYLRTSYHPDVEYVYGELREKPMPTLLHGIVQILLGLWFFNHQEEWGIYVASETRTQVDRNHVRLPDIVVLHWGKSIEGILDNPPLIAIEILSPSDRYSDLCERASDLRLMGTENIWLLDPERRTAEFWTGRNWQALDGNVLQAVGSPVFLDTEWLWAQVDRQKSFQHQQRP